MEIWKWIFSFLNNCFEILSEFSKLYVKHLKNYQSIFIDMKNQILLVKNNSYTSIN